MRSDIKCKNKKRNIKKGCLFAFILLLSVVLIASFFVQNRKMDKSTEIFQEVNISEKSKVVTALERDLKKYYKIDNFKIDLTGAKFNRMNNDALQDGTPLNFLVSGVGTFTYQDKMYDYNYTANITDENNVKLIHLQTSYSKDVISLKLKSEE